MQPRLRNRWLFLKKSMAEDGEGAFPLWQFCCRLGRWEVVQGLAAVLHSVPETVTDRWSVVSSLCQPNPVLEQWAPLELLIENGAVGEALLKATRATAARWAS